MPVLICHQIDMVLLLTALIAVCSVAFLACRNFLNPRSYPTSLRFRRSVSLDSLYLLIILNLILRYQMVFFLMTSQRARRL